MKRKKISLKSGEQQVDNVVCIFVEERTCNCFSPHRECIYPTIASNPLNTSAFTRLCILCFFPDAKDYFP